MTQLSVGDTYDIAATRVRMGIGWDKDAGAGYESLQHVLRLRPEYVKLDRGLISDAHADPAKLAIIEAVGLFAERLGAARSGGVSLLGDDDGERLAGGPVLEPPGEAVERVVVGSVGHEDHGATRP